MFLIGTTFPFIEVNYVVKQSFSLYVVGYWLYQYIRRWIATYLHNEINFLLQSPLLLSVCISLVLCLSLSLSHLFPSSSSSSFSWKDCISRKSFIRIINMWYQSASEVKEILMATGFNSVQPQFSKLDGKNNFVLSGIQIHVRFEYQDLWNIVEGGFEESNDGEEVA